MVSLAGLSGFAIFVAVTGMLLSATMLLVPVIYDKYDKLSGLSRAIREDRVHFIMSTFGIIWLLFIRYGTHDVAPAQNSDHPFTPKLHYYYLSMDRARMQGCIKGPACKSWKGVPSGFTGVVSDEESWVCVFLACIQYVFQVAGGCYVNCWITNCTIITTL